MPTDSSTNEPLARAVETSNGVDMPKVETIPVDAIDISGGTQSRVRVDAETVTQYAEDIRTGVKLPPVDVYFDGKHYWPADGFHRTLATISAGEQTIRANVHTGTKRDAMLHAAGANHSHGLKRTPEDKRNAVEMLLDEGAWCDKSVTWFAANCHVSFSLAQDVYDRWHKNRNRDAPTERVGRDGKTRSIPTTQSERPNTPPPEPHENPERDPSPISKAESTPVDVIGRDIPERYREAAAWNQRAASVIRDIGAIVTRCRELKGEAGGVWFNFAQCEADLGNAQTQVKFGQHYTSCPDCLNDEPKPKCKVCKGHGWINKGIYGRLSDQQKAALKETPF